MSERPGRTRAQSRARAVAAVAGVAGATLLGRSLSTPPGSSGFYRLTGATAATWVAGGAAAAPIRLGPRPRAVLGPVATGAAAFGVFYGAAAVLRHVPVLGRAIGSVLGYAAGAPALPVALTTLANGAAEEVFFRGAVYAAAGDEHPVATSTAVYVLVTAATRNPSLVLAAAVMGTLFGLQRQATGGIQAPLITHLTWSALMLRYLPRLFPAAEAIAIQDTITGAG